MEFLQISFNNAHDRFDELQLTTRPEEVYPHELQALEELRAELASKYPTAEVGEPCAMEVNSQYDLVMDINPERADLESEDDSRVAFIGVIVSVDGLNYVVNLTEKWELESEV